ncbi:cell wall-associated hydrolase, invasion-associated protein [Halobacteroides halobius DSM 5150]|uniref:Cell wall-associated hydrolase, invasion-associated protein n=1 Tax=Halobacteroides halobius (strain ATCC 35273 / DSM 5150 / MD-1) TaxID=748449 RepID=L0KEE0_HALHC|nr:NlpC/P60 family protein [Halobacteroides halobius]AGB42428.1 cell wall-associated hydrolase, invasion-associated protein [Halobacteroides halobius DSM 5150]
MKEEITKLENKMEKVVRKYRNIPYKHNGRSLTGLDCLGLIIGIYDEFGITIPDGDGEPVPEDWYKEDAERYLRGLQKIGQPVEFDKLQVLDLVYFKLLDDIVTHSGVMINDHQFIHILQDKNVEIGTLNRKFWRRKIAGGRRLIKIS